MASTSYVSPENNTTIALTGCQCCCNCGSANSQPPPAYEMSSNSIVQPPPDNSTQAPANSNVQQTVTGDDTGMVDSSIRAGMGIGSHWKLFKTWNGILLHESNNFREHQLLASGGNQAVGPSRKTGIMESFRDRTFSWIPPKLDREKFPYGSYLVSIHREATGGGKCKEHGGHQCFCIAYYHMGNRITCDWKPFATGKYTAMKRNEDCELHGGKKCYCVVRPSETEIVYSYDLKTGKRNRM